VTYSSTSSKALLDPTNARWLATGKFHATVPIAPLSAGQTAGLRTPSSQRTLISGNYTDLSGSGPSKMSAATRAAIRQAGRRVVDPKWQQQMKPGPGQPGFRYTKQNDSTPVNPVRKVTRTTQPEKY
jgi:hypothetical protein